MICFYMAIKSVEKIALTVLISLILSRYLLLFQTKKLKKLRGKRKVYCFSITCICVNYVHCVRKWLYITCEYDFL